MNAKDKVYFSIFFIFILILLLYAFHRWSNSTEPFVQNILRYPPIVSITCPATPNSHPEPSIIASLPVLKYAEGSQALECPVCLLKLEAGERIRLLPKCKHCFHIDCIDMWLQSHATCPLCRSSVESGVVETV